MPNILEEIFAHKRSEVAAAKKRTPIATLEAAAAARPAPPDFAAALRDASRPAPRLIAELKRRSPSRGLLRPDFDLPGLARAYANHGAAAISVLTDNAYFGGSLAALQQTAELNLALPLLRKDFIFDPYQALEARAAGAAALLLIVAMLPAATLRALLEVTHSLGMKALVEAHTADEVRQALDCGAQIIGVNNRDLRTFQVRLETCLELRPLIPAGVVMVAESGIHTREDVSRLAAAGVDAMLIGEALITAPDVRAKMLELTQRHEADA